MLSFFSPTSTPLAWLCCKRAGPPRATSRPEALLAELLGQNWKSPSQSGRRDASSSDWSTQRSHRAPLRCIGAQLFQNPQLDREVDTRGAKRERRGERDDGGGDEVDDGDGEDGRWRCIYLSKDFLKKIPILIAS